MEIFQKFITWGKMVLAACIGLIQAGLKVIKEGLTGLIDLLSIVIPVEKAQEIIEKIREIINSIDISLEGFKAKLLKGIA